MSHRDHIYKRNPDGKDFWDAVNRLRNLTGPTDKNKPATQGEERMKRWDNFLNKLKGGAHKETTQQKNNDQQVTASLAKGPQALNTAAADNKIDAMPLQVTESYIVKEGDTLSSVASSFSISEEELLQLNKSLLGRPGMQLHPGETLRLQASAPEAAQEEIQQEKVKTEATTDPLEEEREKIDVAKDLTAKQKELFNWSQALKEFRMANRVDGKEVNEYELARWTRMGIKSGWTKPGDPVPDIREVKLEKEIKGVPVYSGVNYDLVFAYARKHSLTGTFYWMYNITGEMKSKSPSGTALANPDAFKNYQENKALGEDAFINNLELLYKYSNDKINYERINSIPEFHDKLLSNELVLLVTAAQQKLFPDPKNKQQEWNGILDYRTRFQLIWKPEADKYHARIEKINEDYKATTLSQYGEPAPGGYTHYKRDGRDLYVKKGKLFQLQALLAGGDADGATEFLTTLIEVSEDRYNDFYYMLTAKERVQLLYMYRDHWEIDDKEEKIITRLLTAVPDDQKPALAGHFAAGGFEKLKERFSSAETLKGLTLAKESITGQTDESANKEIEGALEWYSLTSINKEKLEPLTPMQFEKFDLQARKDLFASIVEKEELAGFIDDVIMNTPPAQQAAFIDHLRGEDGQYSLLVKAGKAAKGSEEIGHEGFLSALDVLMKNSEVVTADIRASLLRKDVFDERKLVLYYLPEVAFSKLSEDEIITLIHKCSGDDKDGEKNRAIVLKLLVSRKTAIEIGNSENQQQQKQSFYDKLAQGKKGLEKIKGGFSGDALIELEQLLNSFDSSGTKERVMDITKAGTFSVDDNIASLSDEDMALLPAGERVKMIMRVLGVYGLYVTILSENSTRVGERDEKTIIRLLATAPGEQVAEIFKMIGQDTGALYDHLQHAMDGAEFKKMHAEFAAMKQRIADRNPMAKKRQDELKLKLQLEGMENGLPWKEYSYLGLVMFNTGYEYNVKWGSSETGTLMHVTLTETSLKTLLNGDLLGGVIGSWISNGEKVRSDQWVAIYSPDGDSDLGMAPGEVKVMLGINLLLLENKQDMGHITEVIDIASLLIGISELKAATTLIGRISAILNVVASTSFLLQRAEKEKLDPAWRKEWEEINHILIAAQFVDIGLAALRGLKNRITALGSTVEADCWRLSPQRLGALKKILEELPEAIEGANITSKLDTATLDELIKMRDDLAAKVERTNAEENALRQLNAKIDEIEFKTKKGEELEQSKVEEEVKEELKPSDTSMKVSDEELKRKIEEIRNIRFTNKSKRLQELGWDPDRKLFSEAEANTAFEVEEEWGYFERHQASAGSGKKGDWIGLSGKGKGKLFDDFGSSIPDNEMAVSEITRKAKNKRKFFESLDEHFTKSDYVILNFTNLKKHNLQLFNEAMDYIANTYGETKLINATK